MRRTRLSNPRKGQSFPLRVEVLESREAATGIGISTVLSDPTGIGLINSGQKRKPSPEVSVIQPSTQQMPTDPMFHPQTQLSTDSACLARTQSAADPESHRQIQMSRDMGFHSQSQLSTDLVLHPRTQSPADPTLHSQSQLPTSPVFNPQAQSTSPARMLAAPQAPIQSPRGGRTGTGTGDGTSTTSGPSTPLNDLGTGLYNGQQGGLYANGSNTRSTSLEGTAESIASQIKPLDANGNVDMANGKIVLISIGMSNTAYEFNGGFVPKANADPTKNSQLVIVNGAQSGHPASDWADPNSKVWTTLLNRLSSAGVTAQQVQVAWVKQAERKPEDIGGFLPASQQLQSDLEAIARNMTTYFSNMKLAYLSSRTHAFTTTGLNPEPYAFESGFSVKWTIQDQQDGKNNLNFDASKGKVVAPLLLWGPYLWANGTDARSDGFTWVRSDTGADATHPSGSGVAKVANMLLAFFKTDPTATPWFLRQTPAGMAPTVTASADRTTGASGLTVHFNASATGASGTNISSYAWTFDDGDFAYGATPTKTFYAPGTYHVHLTVSDSIGDVAQRVLTITVTGTTGSALDVAIADVTSTAQASAAAPVQAGNGRILPTIVTAAGGDGFSMAAPTNWADSPLRTPPTKINPFARANPQSPTTSSLSNGLLRQYPARQLTSGRTSEAMDGWVENLASSLELVS